MIWIALVVYLGVILLYLTQPFDPEAWSIIAESYLRIPMQVTVLGAILWRLGGIEGGREAHFWQLWAVATGIWLSIQLVYAFPPNFDERLLALGIESAVAAFYLCILYALSLHPHLDGARGDDLVRRSFEDVAGSIFVFALVVYFAVIAFALKPAAYDSWAPSLTLYVVLDTLVFTRLIYLLRHAGSPRWVALYTGLVITAFFWTVTDLFTVLIQAGFAPRVYWGDGITDWPWFLPYAALIVTARMKDFSFPVVQARTPQVSTGNLRRRWSGVLVGCAVGLPLLHLGFSLSGVLDPDLRGPRDLLVFLAAFVLGGIALLYQSLLEDTNQRLEKEKEVRDRERVQEQLAAARLQERQSVAQARAEGQNVQRLGIMAGGIAQDFDRLLATILENTRRGLQDPDLSGVLQEALSNIEGVADQGSRLTNQLTAYAGRAQVDVQVIDLNKLVRSVGRQVESALEGTSIRCDLSPGLAHLHGDTTQLTRVIGSLMTKALEGHGAGTGTLTVRTEARYVREAFPSQTQLGRELPPGHYLVIQVMNNGSEMDPETAALILDPLANSGSGSGETDPEWTSILSALRSHGGSIEIDSEAGHGSTVTIMLPIIEPRAPTESGEPDMFRSLAQPGTVLIVESEASARTMLRATLVRSGFTVLTATDGVEGVRVFRDRGADITAVLLDADMPDRAGAAALREMHELNAEIPVLLMSGPEGSPLEASAGDMSAGLLRKPFHPQAAVYRLRKLLSPDRAGSTPTPPCP